jgi:hypothetical protein
VLGEPLSGHSAAAIVPSISVFPPDWRCISTLAR